MNKQALALSGESISVSSEIMLWHNRLGHSSFPYLKSLFPSLLRIKMLIHFIVKFVNLPNTLVFPFPSNPYRSSKPFSLVYSDI